MEHTLIKKETVAPSIAPAQSDPFQQQHVNEAVPKGQLLHPVGGGELQKSLVGRRTIGKSLQCGGVCLDLQ